MTNPELAKTLEEIVEKVVASTVTETIKSLRCECYPEEHKDFIQSLILREQRAAERWETVKTQILGWGIIAAAGSIGAYALDHFRF